MVETIQETFATAEDRRKRVRELLDSLGSRFGRVDFVKKDGTARRMIVQPATGPVRLAQAPEASPQGKAAALTRAANNPNLVNVWDSIKMAWRSVNLDTVIAIKVNGKEYKF